MQLLLDWDFNVSLWVSAAIVLVYITLGGLTSAIYNEVLQFFLIALGFLPLVCLGLYDVGGWTGLKAKLTEVAVASPQHYRAERVDQRLGEHGRRSPQPDAHRVVWHGGRARVSCWRSAIGVPTSWWCSGRWRPSRCRPRGARR